MRPVKIECCDNCGNLMAFYEIGQEEQCECCGNLDIMEEADETDED